MAQLRIRHSQKLSNYSDANLQRFKLSQNHRLSDKPARSNCKVCNRKSPKSLNSLSTGLSFPSAITSPGKEPILERPKCETPVCLNGFSLRKKSLILMLLPYVSPILYSFYYSALWYFWRTRHPINIHIFSLLPQQPSQVKQLLKLFQFQACDI